MCLMSRQAQLSRQAGDGTAYMFAIDQMHVPNPIRHTNIHDVPPLSKQPCCYNSINADMNVEFGELSRLCRLVLDGTCMFASFPHQHASAI